MFQKILKTILLFVGLFFAGYYIGVRGIIFDVSIKKPYSFAVKNQLAYSTKVDFSKFWQVWDASIANQNKATVDKLYYNAMVGMVGSLGDPYTAFLPPHVNKTIGDDLNGKYQGIGAELGMDNGQLMVVAPIDGSPAKAAGLKSGDKLLKIDGVTTAGITVSEAAGKIRGDAGTVVVLTAKTGDDPERDIKITRGVISVASVKWQDKGNGVAYIRISSFGAKTNVEWDKAVSDITMQMSELNTVVVDVRGNPGGYLQSAVHIIEEFYNGKPALWEEDAAGKQTPLMANRYGSFMKVPTVYVLIDQGSASASEIVAGALRAEVHAKLIGVKSFGKGTVQDAQDFKDGSGIHITIAKWLTPDKIWVHKVGLTPDVVVEITPEDVKNGVDPQLNKVLEFANPK